MFSTVPSSSSRRREEAVREDPRRRRPQGRVQTLRRGPSVSPLDCMENTNEVTAVELTNFMPATYSLLELEEVDSEHEGNELFERQICPYTQLTTGFSTGCHARTRLS